jgi:MSHA biogenesis protein MshI
MRLSWRRGGQDEGWLAISLQPDGLAFAHAKREKGAWRVTRCGSRPLADASADLERASKQLELNRHRCLTLLGPSEYQVLLVDAPNVPPAEQKSAARWRIKDLIDYRVEDATVDVLDVPPEGGRGHSMYAIAARNETIRACIARFEAAKIPLSVIDIAETSQRNIAALFEAPPRALAFLYVGPAHTLLTINHRAELYLARRIDVGMAGLAADAADEAKSRILLEVQRSLDHFDRQFPSLGLGRLLIGPEPSDTGLVAFLAANMDVKVERAQLAEVLQFDPGCIQDAEALWRLFPVLGAALRNGETRKAGA